MNFYPDVSIVYSDNFPPEFINDVNGWAFSKEVIENNTGELLTLDIDFGNKCSLNCPHCFKKGAFYDTEETELNIPRLKEIILEAKTLGLKSVKFVGKGEPLETPEILEFLEFLHSHEITPLIFTKGHILADDKVTQAIYNHFGIKTSRDLVSRLFELNVSVLLGFNSFNPAIQDEMVGKISGYTELRNRALELLVEAGFNKTNPTRLSLICAPLTNKNYNDAFRIYEWGRRRNLYPVITPTMVSGIMRNNDNWKKVTPSEEKLIDLYSEIYKFNIDNNIQSIEQIKAEGISAYAGAHTCNQVSVGMYLTTNGTIIRCPGDDKGTLGNINRQSLTEIWQNYNKNSCRNFNDGCHPKYGKSIPVNFFDKVFLKLNSII